MTIDVGLFVLRMRSVTSRRRAEPPACLRGAVQRAKATDLAEARRSHVTSQRRWTLRGRSAGRMPQPQVPLVASPRFEPGRVERVLDGSSRMGSVKSLPGGYPDATNPQIIRKSRSRHSAGPRGRRFKSSRPTNFYREKRREFSLLDHSVPSEWSFPQIALGTGIRAQKRRYWPRIVRLLLG